MIRFVLLFCVLAAPLAAQTALSDRPGLWISVPRTTAPVLEAPASSAVVLEAPTSGPLITGTPERGILLTVPEVSETAILITPSRAPEMRPVPRPISRVVEEIAVAAPAVVEEPDIAAAALASPAVAEPPAGAAPEVAVEPQTLSEPPAVARPVAPIDVATAPIAPGPAVQAPQTRPLPRPETAATAAFAEALAAQIAAEAHAIMAAAPSTLPAVDGIAPAEALAPVGPVVVSEAAASTPVPMRVLTPPTVVPALPMAFAPVSLTVVPVAMPTVLLPDSAVAVRPAVQPVAFIMPPLETTPILPRQHPSGPAAQEVVSDLPTAHTNPLSAVLLPSVARPVAPTATSTLAPAPARDPFPFSALPPTELPPGPDSLTRTIQPPRQFAEVNAAVLTGRPLVIPVRMPVLSPSATPAFDAPVTDPDAPVALPAPDHGALARMIDDAMICWRLADLSVEAQWARLSVDVALDETNMPSEQSIRLTGFAGVVSGAAEDAYRAAFSALTGCAEATGNEPATTSATLIFDRSGVRLQ